MFFPVLASVWEVNKMSHLSIIYCEWHSFYSKHNTSIVVFIFLFILFFCTLQDVIVCFKLYPFSKRMSCIWICRWPKAIYMIVILCLFYKKHICTMFLFALEAWWTSDRLGWKSIMFVKQFLQVVLFFGLAMNLFMPNKHFFQHLPTKLYMLSYN